MRYTEESAGLRLSQWEREHGAIEVIRRLESQAHLLAALNRAAKRMDEIASDLLEYGNPALDDNEAADLAHEAMRVRSMIAKTRRD